MLMKTMVFANILPNNHQEEKNLNITKNNLFIKIDY